MKLNYIVKPFTPSFLNFNHVFFLLSNPCFCSFYILVYSATVVFEITEVLANENNPIFNESSYSVNVTENSSPGMVVQVGRICLNIYIFV